ncbi:MAG: ribosome maturation factor RimM [Bradyrhizobiaceae bacterium]|nr:ribosome maturation factor RimM [Hyphomicrobiales bacterium]MBV9429027.1 ribosome maturation factor RimM [Bradyrhizobiaceae bacterium]
MARRHPARSLPEAASRVCVAEIGAAHGITGEVRLRAFTEDPLTVKRFGPLQAEDGREITIAAARPGKDCLIARIAGVADRTAAERLRNVKLYVPREKLPAIDEPETYYHADLIGLSAVGPDGAAFGHVVAVQNFGAGDLLEIAPAAGGPTVLLLFTDAAVPLVDVANGRVVVNLPPGPKTPLVVPRESGAPSKRRRRNAGRPVVTGSSASADDDD